jgi:hypothetical protein
MKALDLIAEAHADLKAVHRISELCPDWATSESKIRITTKLMQACNLISHPEEERDEKQPNLFPGNPTAKEKAHHEPKQNA